MNAPAAIKLDENLGRAIADLLAEAGHDVATVHDQQMTSAPDSALIAACSAEGRCLVTLDLGFANPLSYDARRHTERYWSSGDFVPYEAEEFHARTGNVCGGGAV